LPTVLTAHPAADPAGGAWTSWRATILRGLLGEEPIRLFLAVKRHEIAKATAPARDYTADDWMSRVDEFEVAELFEFL
jgi:hypothetical protein